MLGCEPTLRGRGCDVGPHHRIVAATAISLGWRVAATGDVGHFEWIAGLDVVGCVEATLSDRVSRSGAKSGFQSGGTEGTAFEA